MQRGPQDWDAGPSVVDSLLRHKWLVALAVLLGLVAAYGWSARQPERYEATLQLFAERGRPGRRRRQDPDRILRNHVERLNSAAVLDQAVDMSDRPITRGQLKDSLSIEAAGDADVITIRVLDATPEGAEYLAELIPRAYQRTLSQRARQSDRRDPADPEPARGRARADRRARSGAARRPEPRGRPGGGGAGPERRPPRTSSRPSRPPPTCWPPLGGLEDEAVVGDEPAQPQPRRAAAVGALLGLAISVALVSWRTGQQLRGGTAGAKPAEIPEEVSRDLAILAEADAVAPATATTQRAASRRPAAARLGLPGAGPARSRPGGATGSPASARGPRPRPRRPRSAGRPAGSTTSTS